jgi:hypothetical protein
MKQWLVLGLAIANNERSRTAHLKIVNSLLDFDLMTEDELEARKPGTPDNSDDEHNSDDS